MKTTLCHHCGNQIVWCPTWPDKKNSHWSHPARSFVSGGKRHYVYNEPPANATMEQRCPDGRNWATPARSKKTLVNIQHEETGRLQEWNVENAIPYGWAKVSDLFTEQPLPATLSISPL